MRELDLRL